MNYYHANIKNLLRCTRVYALKRENRIEAFGYVVATMKEAAHTPEEFIEPHVIGEVRELMDGSARCRCTLEKGKMLVDGEEKALLFKMEKINGRYKFIGNLSEIAEACPRIREELSGYISELMEMYAALLPEVEEGMVTVSERLRGVENALLGAQAELKMVTDALSPLLCELSRPARGCAKGG